jgi:hypothetical protein
MSQSLTSLAIAASSKATQKLLAGLGFKRKSMHLLRRLRSLLAF